MKLFRLLVLSLVLGAATSAWCSQDEGPTRGGGGDEYTLDFIRVARHEIYPWLRERGRTLSPRVNARSFLRAIDPKKISSLSRVYESCDGSQNGREVTACYSASADKIFISRSRYPLVMQKDPAKRGIVAHEIFRRMGIEGDQYEVTRQIPILVSPNSTAEHDIAACNSIMGSMSSLIDSYINAIKTCYKLEDEHRVNSDDYRDHVSIVRRIESIYADSVLLCGRVCADRTVCDAPGPARACQALE